MTVPPPRPPGNQRTGIVEGWELRRTQRQDANSGAWKGFAFVFGLVALIAILWGGHAYMTRTITVPPAALEISRETTYLTQPLTLDGRVDYLAALNSEPLPAPAENAAVLIAKVLGFFCTTTVAHSLAYSSDLSISPVVVYLTTKPDRNVSPAPDTSLMSTDSTG